ncbi:MAG: T9SS type A sorting domain-containing protein [Saprospiraceae bacterium]|nr:T9SS type A sorting domain-containing protein [Saprospiraceae bacterium]
MKNCFIACLLIFQTTLLFAQFTPDVGWGRTQTAVNGLPGSSWIDMWVSGNGEVYSLGAMFSSLILTPNDTLFNNNNVGDFFVMKTNRDGDFQWKALIKTTGSAPILDYEIAAKIAGDAAGNVYVCGNLYGGGVNFGNGITLTKTCFPSCRELFLVKYNSIGVAQWAKIIEAENDSRHKIGGLACDETGSVLLTGTYGGSAIKFGDAPFDYINLPGTGFFLARFNSDGDPVWVKFLESNSNSAEAVAMCISPTQRVYVTGTYVNGDLAFEPGVTLPMYSGNNAFVARFDLSGNAVWAQNLNSPNLWRVNDIVADADQFVYIACRYFAELNTGDNPLEITSGLNSAIIAMETNTIQVPVTVNSEFNDDVFTAIDVIPGGEFYTAGIFNSPELEIAGQTLTNNGCSDLVFLEGRFDGLDIAYKYGGTGCEYIQNPLSANAVGLDELGFLYVQGNYSNGLDLGGFVTIGSGMFLARLNTSIISTDEPVEPTPFEVMPNPNNGTFTLQSKSGDLEGILRVFDASGKLHYEKTISGINQNFNLDLSTGVYMFTLTSKEGIAQQKISVVK